MVSQGSIKLELSLTSLVYPREKKRETKPLLIDLMHQSHYKAKWVILFLCLLLFILSIAFEYIYYNLSISGAFVSTAGSLAALLLIEQLKLGR